MRLLIEIEPGEEEAALAFLHEKMPQTKPLTNIVGGNLAIEADLDLSGKTVRAKVELVVKSDPEHG